MKAANAHAAWQHYRFDNGDAQAQFDLTWQDEIEVRNMYAQSPQAARQKFDRMGIQPEYVRYYATGQLTLTQNGQTTTQRGHLIYEYNYLGKPTPEAHV